MVRFHPAQCIMNIKKYNKEQSEAKYDRERRWRHRQDYLGFFGMPSKHVCLVCKKAGQLPLMCCNRYTYSLYFKLRSPTSCAGRGKWKKFETLLFRSQYNLNNKKLNDELDRQS